MCPAEEFPWWRGSDGCTQGLEARKTGGSAGISPQPVRWPGISTQQL